MNSTTCFLLLVCGSLLLVIFVSLANPPAMPSLPEAVNLPMKDDAKTQRLEYTPPPASNFSIIYERPLFWRSRTAFVGQPEKIKSKTMRPLDGVLVGVHIINERRRALLRLAPNEEEYDDDYDGVSAIRVQEGQEIDGWQIETIEKDQIVLRQGDVVQVLKLYNSTHSQVQIAPRPANDSQQVLVRQIRRALPEQRGAPNAQGMRLRGPHEVSFDPPRVGEAMKMTVETRPTGWRLSARPPP